MGSYGDWLGHPRGGREQLCQMLLIGHLRWGLGIKVEQYFCILCRRFQREGNWWCRREGRIAGTVSLSRWQVRFIHPSFHLSIQIGQSGKSWPWLGAHTALPQWTIGGKEEQGTLTREVGCHGGGRLWNFSSEGFCSLSAVGNKMADYEQEWGVELVV